MYSAREKIDDVMPVNYSWYSEHQQIMLLHYEGEWTFDEALIAIQGINRMARTLSSRFDIIADLSETAYTPPVGFLWEWRQTVEIREAEFPHWALSVLVGTNAVFKAYFTEAAELSSAIRNHTRLAKTREEAVQIILSDRKTES